MMSNVLSLIVVIFMSTTVFFITKYTKILKLAQDEYVDAKNIVGAIIHHFRNHQDRQLQNVEHLSLKVDVVQTEIKNLSKEIKSIEEQIAPIKFNEDQRLNGNEEAINQLYRYFSVVEARVGIFTNGIIYKFYSDLEEPNKMDTRPFLVFDMLNIQESLVDELKKLTKDAFNLVV